MDAEGKKERKFPFDVDADGGSVVDVVVEGGVGIVVVGVVGGGVPEGDGWPVGGMPPDCGVLGVVVESAGVLGCARCGPPAVGAPWKN